MRALYGMTLYFFGAGFGFVGALVRRALCGITVGFFEALAACWHVTHVRTGVNRALYGMTLGFLIVRVSF